MVFSSATHDPFKESQNRSISIGILLSPHLKKKINFLNDKNISKKIVEVTCETCAVKNCLERVANPLKLDYQTKQNKIEENVEQIVSIFT